MADKLLEVKGVSKIFRVGGMLRGKKLVAVDNVSLSIDDDKPVILSIVGELEDEFDVSVTPADIIPENFNSAQAIWAMVQRLQGEA